jgi:hypothetical protein
VGHKKGLVKLADQLEREWYSHPRPAAMPARKPSEYQRKLLAELVDVIREALTCSGGKSSASS